MVLGSGRTVSFGPALRQGERALPCGISGGTPAGFSADTPTLPSVRIHLQAIRRASPLRAGIPRAAPLARAPANRGVPALGRPRPAPQEKTPSLARRSWPVGFAAMEMHSACWPWLEISLRARLGESRHPSACKADLHLL